MRSYTIYTGSSADMLECAVIDDARIILRTRMSRELSAPVEIETANICLRSEYDAEQTLIPGVTKRIVNYRGRDLKFSEIRWNRDETYTISFPNEEVIAKRVDARTFMFTQDGKETARIVKAADKTAVEAEGTGFEPAYVTEFEEGLSQQALIMILVFPVLYFGF